MHSVRIHPVMNLISLVFYRIGFWYRGDVSTPREFALKLFYCFYFSLAIILFLVGAVTNESLDESMFLAETGLVNGVLLIKLWFVMWKQQLALDLLDRLCIFSIRHEEDFNFFTKKLGKLMKFVSSFISATFVFSSAAGILPVVGNQKKFFVDIPFPFDYEKSDILFLIASTFVFSESILAILIVTSSTVIWYIMFHCSVRCEVLGREMQNMGRNTGNGKMSKKEKQNIFLRELKTSIEDFLHMKGLIDEVESYTANLFLIQFATSGVCICGSVYCLAFVILKRIWELLLKIVEDINCSGDVSDNFMGLLVSVYLFSYNICELFVITYFGNEIMLSTNQLSYNLFESNWTDQPQSTKMCIIIFGEYLKQPRELLVGKLYPLTLETFSRILNSAYSMFNILKNSQTGN